MLKKFEGSFLSKFKQRRDSKVTQERVVTFEKLSELLVTDFVSVKLLKKIFDAYTSEDQTVEVRKIFVGLSSCCAGTTDEKLKYCFTLYDMDRDNKLTRNELGQLLESLWRIRVIHQQVVRSTSVLMTMENLPPDLIASSDNFVADSIVADSVDDVMAVSDDTVKTNKTSTIERTSSSESRPPSGNSNSAKKKLKFFGFERENQILKTFSQEKLPSVNLPGQQINDTTSQVITNDSAQDSISGTILKIVNDIFETYAEKETISSENFLRWLHRHPTAVSFLDKVQHIASAVVEKEAQRHLSKEEREIIRPLFAKQNLSPGDKCYLLSSKWWRFWKDYVNFDSKNDAVLPNEGEEIVYAPASIDNTDLLAENYKEILESTGIVILREKLLETIDYIAVTEEIWNVLHSWYGGGPVIVRQVLPAEKGRRLSLVDSDISIRSTHLPSTHIDLYPLILNIGYLDNKTTVSKCMCSSNAAVKDLRDIVSKQLNMNESKVDMWMFLPGTEPLPIKESSLTLRQLGIVNDHTILVARGRHSRQSSLSSWLSLRRTSEVAGNSNGSLPSLSASAIGNGLVGLTNLGNTCFLNSALQCLVHIQTLAEYFLSNKYKSDINKSESNAHLTTSFADLMDSIWSVKASGHIAPQKFRSELIRRFPQFYDYDQHDSQEALGAILDALHTDLNLVKKKESRENPDFNGHTDEELSQIYWTNHLLRESSLIVSLFQGQFKTETQCTICHHRIIKFHPFLFLSAPLPSLKKRTFNIVIVPLGPKNGPLLCKIDVPVDGIVRDIVTAIRNVDTKFKNSSFIVADVQSSYIFGVMKQMRYVSEIRERDTLCAYEIASNGYRRLDSVMNLNEALQDLENDAKTKIRVQFVHRTFIDPHAPNRRRVNLLGLPFLYHFEAILDNVAATVPQYTMSAAIMYQNIHDRIQDLFGFSAKCGTEEGEYYTFILRFVQPIGIVCSRCTLPGCSGCVINVEDECVVLYENDSIAIEWTADAVIDGKTISLKEVLQKVESHNSAHSQSNSIITLKDILREYEKPEMLGCDEFSCPKCKEPRQGIRRETIWRFPPLLMIQLKRFSYTAQGCTKNTQLVSFPFENWSTSPYQTKNAEGNNQNLIELLPKLSLGKSPTLSDSETKDNQTSNIYNLYGMINHFGSFYNGHYVAHVKNYRNQKWYLYNDQSCSEVERHEILSPSDSAYVLIYQRNDMSPLDSFIATTRLNLEQITPRTSSTAATATTRSPSKK